MAILQPILGPLCVPVVRGIADKGVGAFSPASLFAAGEQGAWWDNQDLSTLFSDALRTTRAVVGGEVLGQSDKSGNGRHRSGTAGTGPILQQRSDGVYYLDYAGGKTLSVPSSTALFKFLHDGSGGSISAMIEWQSGSTSSSYLRTASITGHIGVNITKFTTDQSVMLEVNTGGVQACSGRWYESFNSSVPHMMMLSYKNDGASDDLTIYEDSSVTAVRTAPTAGTPSSANSSLNLQVATNYNSKEYEVVIVSKKLDQSTSKSLWSHMRISDYMVPSSTDITLLLGGQSNMSGRGTLTAIAAEQKLVGVYSYTKAGEYRIASVPEHSMRNRTVVVPVGEAVGAAQHGLALRLGKSIYTTTGNTVLLAPCASGSTSISDWDTPETTGDQTTLFGSMIYRYKNSSGKHGLPVIVWFGHENSAGLPVPDYTNGGVGNAYQLAWTSLINDVREFNGIAGAPLIFCQLAARDTLTPSIELASVGEAQRQSELSMQNAFMVVTHDVARNASPDDIHVSRAGVDVVADRVALAIRQHILGEPVNGTGPRIAGATKSGAVVTLTCDKAINASAGNYGNLFRVYASGVEQTVSSAVRNADTTKIDITCSATLTGTVTLTYGYRAGAASAARTDFVMDSDSMPLPLFGPIVVS